MDIDGWAALSFTASSLRRPSFSAMEARKHFSEGSCLCDGVREVFRWSVVGIIWRRCFFSSAERVCLCRGFFISILFTVFLSFCP